MSSGDIVALTPNVYNLMNRKSSFHHCSFCLRSNDMDLLPCPECPTAMYCSRRCLLEDRDECHQNVCGKSVNFEPFSAFLQLLKRRSMKIFEASSEFVEKNLTQSSVFDFDFSRCRNPITCKNLMLATFGQKQSSIGSDILTKFLLRLSSLQYFASSNNIWTSSKISEGNLWGKMCNDLFVNNIGWNFHPLKLVFNTSCHPNIHIMGFNENGVSAWIVKYPIEAGKQLFLRYQTGHDWYTINKVERQNHWMSVYGFVCNCEACSNNWDVKQLRDHHKIHSCIPKTLPSREEATKTFKENCKYINKHYKKEYPSVKIIALDASNDIFLQSIKKSVVFP